MFFGAEGTRHLPITISLHEGLLRLRWTSKERRLWVDAVCIDQDDLDERADQVQLMHLIYKQADLVICWLGEDDELDDGAKAIDLIVEIGLISFRSASRFSPPQELMRSHNLPGPKDAVWVSLVAFFNRPWFRRCWAVQEFVLGKRAELMCGARCVDWRDIESGVRKLSEYALARWGVTPLIQSDQARHPPAHGRLLRELPSAEAAITDFRAIATLRENTSPDDWFHNNLKMFAIGDKTLEDLDIEFEAYRNPMVALFLREYRPILSLPTGQAIAQVILERFRGGQIQHLAPLDMRRAGFPIVAIAFHLKNRLAVDPRDRLFSLLGIAEEGEHEALRPSYTEPVASTYTRFARHLITNATTRGTMFILLEAGLHTQPAKPNPELPSWVYDWSHRPIFESNSLASIGANAQCFHAAGDALPEVAQKTSSHELKLKGALVDSVGEMVTCASLIDDRDEDGNQIYHLTEEGKFNVDVSDPISVELFIARIKRLLQEEQEPARDLQRFFAKADGLFLDPERPLRRSEADETRQEVLWRTLIANLGVSGARRLTLASRRLEAEYLGFRRWLAALEGPGDMSSMVDHTMSYDAGHWPKMFFNLSQYYAICKTTSGWAGLVPRCTVRGDEVHVILGADMPVVLRPSSDSSQTYKVVGACYVHGLMQGEFLQDRNWEEKEICLI